MPQTVITLEKKQQHYRDILVREFLHKFQFQAETVDLDTLLLIEKVAQQAAYRYSYIIDVFLTDSLSEGVMPFAKVGVARMLEYITCKKLLQPTVGDLLQGLIEGRSGANIQGHTNTELKAKNDQESYMAEAIYGHSAFRSQKNGDLYTLNKDISSTHYYTKFVKKHPKNGSAIGNPKYGYAFVPHAVIMQYGSKQHQLNPTLQTQIKNYLQPIKETTRKEVEAYLMYLQNSNKKHSVDSPLSFNDFIAQQCGQAADTLIAVCAEDLSGLNIFEANFDGTILDGITLTGNIEKTTFRQASLRHADLSGVNQVIDVSFTRAHLEYLQAPHVQFKDVNFTQAKLIHANLARADLKSMIAFDTVWIKANLDGITLVDSATDIQQLQKLQEDQWRQQQVEVVTQRQMFEKLQKQNQTKRVEFKELAAQCIQQLGNLKKSLHVNDMLILVNRLADKQKLWETFERACQAEIMVLHQEIMSCSTQLATKTTKKIDYYSVELHKKLTELAKLSQEIQSTSEKTLIEQLEFMQQIQELTTLLQENQMEPTKLKKKLHNLEKSIEKPQQMADVETKISQLREGIYVTLASANETSGDHEITNYIDTNTTNQIASPQADNANRKNPDYISGLQASQIFFNDGVTKKDCPTPTPYITSTGNSKVTVGKITNITGSTQSVRFTLSSESKEKTDSTLPRNKF